jgi:transcriptional regulator with XRE-family HTH domain
MFIMGANDPDIGEDGLRELRDIRLRRGLSQADLSAKTGVAEFTISQIEAGKRANPRPSTLRKLAQALDVEVADLYGSPENPLAEAPPSQEKLFNNGILEEERRTGYLRAWRAFVWKLVHRWEQEPPKTSREIAVVLESIQALVEEGAFGPAQEEVTASNWRDASEGLDQQALVLGLQRLNAIADTVKGDETAQQRRELLEALPGGLSA